jgi:16S rRNA (guanine527-N7)-methyltransferase
MTKTGISAIDIETALTPYLATISPGLADQIQAYISLLLKWNRTISLTTVTKPIEIVKFHFGESLFALSLVNSGESRLADVGSGAGFPGLPLAIALPTLDVTLIESNAKKCSFLSEVVRELRLPNVSVFRGRMQELPRDSPTFDVVAARAIGQLEQLATWSRKYLRAAGKLVLWVGEVDARAVLEIDAWSWGQPVLIPGSKRRYLLVGTPST